MAYRHKELESRWQTHWQKKKVFKTGEDFTKPKFYVLDMFPYPSATGLHVGHPLGYTATDIIARYKRMRGMNVLHPMGWDAFGLPAEQHAIETKEHPAKLTQRSIENFKNQLKMLGFSYDWDREVATCDPRFFRWTQWIFCHLYRAGLVYQEEVLVNWCPELKTVLANEEVLDGKSERGGFPVHRVPMRQWMMRITAYAERLLQDLDGIDWPESTKDIQRHWIGKSQGARIRFAVDSEGKSRSIEVFTTRPDTLFGVSYLVLAPEHELVQSITTKGQQSSVLAYKEAAAHKSDLERGELNKEKTGVFTGCFAIHPLSEEKIPIWISDYVLAGYGTGAVMAVPAHDARDHAFALNFDLSLSQVIFPKTGETQVDIRKQPYTEAGVLGNSGAFSGMTSEQAGQAIIEALQKQGKGEKSVTYRLRDWVFSRQRYWGEPIPVVKDSLGRVLRVLGDDELPLTLPEVISYEPTADGKSPIASARSWVQRHNAQGEPEFLETDTMPGSAGSSWYFLRYTDPLNTECLASFAKLAYWLPVDLYIGGQEHAVGHLLYARFWTKVLFDAGLCPVSEPFQKLVHQGMICKDGAKMSKSKGNGVNPDDIVRDFGADALRVYEMFMGPLSQTKEWDESNLAGVRRFLSRIEAFCLSHTGESLLTDDRPSLVCLKMLHKTIKKVSEDMETLSFNTSIAQMMIFLNTVVGHKCQSKDLFADFFKILSPFAPHLAEELWSRCIVGPSMSPDDDGYPFVCAAPWPAFDPVLVRDDTVTLGVQVNGKHRGEITLQENASEGDAVAAARAVSSVQAALGEKQVVKVVYVAGRILNFVVKP